MAFLVRISPEAERPVRVQIIDGDIRSIDMFPKKGQGDFIPPLVVGPLQGFFALFGKGYEATKEWDRDTCDR